MRAADYLSARASARACISVDLVYMRICGDPAAAILLSYLADMAALYRDGPAWWPLSWATLRIATGLGRKPAMRAMERLKRLGLADTQVRCLPSSSTRQLFVCLRGQELANQAGSRQAPAGGGIWR